VCEVPLSQPLTLTLPSNRSSENSSRCGCHSTSKRVPFTSTEKGPRLTRHGLSPGTLERTGTTSTCARPDSITISAPARPTATTRARAPASRSTVVPSEKRIGKRASSGADSQSRSTPVSLPTVKLRGGSQKTASFTANSATTSNAASDSRIHVRGELGQRSSRGAPAGPGSLP
jgi:hypothetical protein